MSNSRCPQCGLMNFASAESCKRCQTLFTEQTLYEAGQKAAQTSQPLNYEAAPWRTLPPQTSGDMPSFAPRPSTGIGRKIIAGVVLLAAFLIRFYVVSGSRGCSELSLAYEVGRFTGYLLIVAAISYLIWRFFLGKTNDRWALNMFMLGVVAVTGWQVQVENDAYKMATASLHHLIAMNGGAKANDEVMQKDTSPYPKGGFKRVVRVLEDAAIDLHNETASYGSIQDWVTHLEGYLSPIQLSSHEEVQRKREQIAELQAFVDQRAAQINRIASQAEAELSSVYLEGCVERDYVSAGRTGIKNIREKTAELFSIDRDAFKQAEDLLAFIDALRAYDSVIHTQYIFTFKFTSSEDQKRYDSMMERLNKLIEREQKWHENASETLMQYSEKLKGFDE